MLFHCVYFWLKPNLADEDVRTFEEGLQSLLSIESVRTGHVGTPASTERPVIDRSYQYALVVSFDDVAGHDAYQDHPVHDAFRQTCARFWSEVKIYDSIGSGRRR